MSPNPNFCPFVGHFCPFLGFFSFFLREAAYIFSYFGPEARNRVCTSKQDRNSCAWFHGKPCFGASLRGQNYGDRPDSKTPKNKITSLDPIIRISSPIELPLADVFLFFPPSCRRKISLFLSCMNCQNWLKWTKVMDVPIPTGKDTCACFCFRTWITNSIHMHIRENLWAASNSN